MPQSNITQQLNMVQQLIQNGRFDDPRIDDVKDDLAKSKHPAAHKKLVQLSVAQAKGLARPSDIKSAKSIGKVLYPKPPRPFRVILG